MSTFPKPKRTINLGVTLFVLLVFGVSCAGEENPDASLEDITRYATGTAQAAVAEADLAPTQTPPPTATLELPTATLVPPTNTLLPSATPILPDAIRINFAPGATYGIITGTIRTGETKNFVLKALAGQPMLVSVNPPNSNITLSIIAGNGAELLSAQENRSGWQGTLPATQNYYFQLSGAQSSKDFTLWVSIPSRIEFDLGATSGTVEGVTVEGYNASYVIAAQGGQTMDILLSPTPDAAALTVWGFSDGQPYMRSVLGSTTFYMQLPSTQDYIIDVVPFAGQEVSFTLRVEIK